MTLGAAQEPGLGRLGDPKMTCCCICSIVGVARAHRSGFGLAYAGERLILPPATRFRRSRVDLEREAFGAPGIGRQPCTLGHTARVGHLSPGRITDGRGRLVTETRGRTDGQLSVQATPGARTSTPSTLRHCRSIVGGPAGPRSCGVKPQDAEDDRGPGSVAHHVLPTSESARDERLVELVRGAV